MMGNNVLNVVGKAQFDEIISSADNAGKIIFVDFWASWCGPCRMLGPVLHEVADKNEEKMLVLKIDVDNGDNGDLSREFGVRSIPQVTLFKDGKKVDQFVGALPADQIEAFLTKNA